MVSGPLPRGTAMKVHRPLSRIEAIHLTLCLRLRNYQNFWNMLGVSIFRLTPATSFSQSPCAVLQVTLKRFYVRSRCPMSREESRQISSSHGPWKLLTTSAINSASSPVDKVIAVLKSSRCFFHPKLYNLKSNMGVLLLAKY